MQSARSCPLDYRLPADSVAGEPLFDCQSLYIAGGLCSNRQTLCAMGAIR